ncbi:MAG: hypothetical protein ACXVAX_01970 [Pseudobdellovibrio sp.]
MALLNRILLSIGIIFSVLAVAVLTYAAEEEEEATAAPVVAPAVEEVIVFAHDLCNPHELQKILNGGFEPIYGGLTLPGDNICGEAKCAQDYFTAGRKGGRITAIDESDRKFTIETSYSSNFENRITNLQKKYPEFEFKPEKISPPSGYYSLSLDVKFDEMFNADEKDIQIFCPTDSCTMVLFAISESNIYFIQRKNGDGSFKREFIIHPGLGSKVIPHLTAGSSAPDYRSHLEKCEYDPKSSSQDQGPGAKHRHP